MNYQLVSQIMKGFWAINEDVAETFFPFAQNIITPGAIVSELTFNEKDYQAYAIDRTLATHNYRTGWAESPKNSIAVIPIHGALMRADQSCGPVGMETIGVRIKEAEANQNIDGILYLVNSPGGTVDGVHELGEIMQAVSKPNLVFTKGMMASAAVWLASFSNKRIAASNRTKVGSVGVMMGYRDLSGAKDKLGVKDHIIRSSYSPNKVKYGEQIESGDYKAIQKEMIDPIAEDFIQTVKTNLPGIKEEHLKGDEFYAQDVIGSFIDAIGNFDFAVSELNQLIEESTQANSNNHSNTYAMEKQYSKVNAALGVEALESEEAGIYLQEEQIATLEAALDQSATEEKITQAQSDLAQAKEDLATAQEQLQTAQANNAKLVEQIENAGAADAAGTSSPEENIEGADAQDEFEDSISAAAREKLNEY